MDESLKFIDFCSGIGAGRIGLEKKGMQCIGFSEIDKNAEKTYRLFFGDEEKNYGDLTKINPKQLPDFDFLIAGFPCQTFSVIGQRKGMDDKRGQIIFSLIEILKEKNIKYFLLENVKGLVNHDGGNSFKVILKALDEAGYNVSYKVLNSLDYGVPQMRERIYFVGFKKDILPKNFSFQFPKPNLINKDLKDFLIDNVEMNDSEKKQTFQTFLRYLGNSYNKNNYKIPDMLKQEYLVVDTRQSDLRQYINKVPTLRLGRHGILYVKESKFRKLSGYEALLLQGIPRYFAEVAKNNMPDITLLKQAGNAMTATTIEAIGKKMVESIQEINIKLCQTYKLEVQKPQKMDLEMSYLL
jgi:DNA (cytosine-5)-methyltransferase 1